MNRATYHVDFDREADGRWIAEVRELAGVIVYETTRARAYHAAVALALRVLAERYEHGEDASEAVIEGIFATA